MKRPSFHTLLASLASAVALHVPLASQAQVGLTQWQAGSTTVTLVYPTAAQSQPSAFGPITLDVARGADPSPGRRRLVLMSHGSGGSPAPDHALAATLVRAGFVVAQLLHEGDNYLDQRLAGPESFRKRPQEAMHVIDALAADPDWSQRLDLGKVGVHGMSAGGVTALSLAGGQWRTLNLVRHCNAHLQDDVAFCFNGALTTEEQAKRQARFNSARFWPEVVLPAELKSLQGGRTPTEDQPDPRPDARIASVTAAVPVAAIFSARSLARIQVPVGILSAQNDTVLVPQFHSSHVLNHCPTCTLLADLPGGHFDVLWPWPEGLAREVAAKQVRGGLPTPGFNPALREEAHARIAEFHRRHLLP